MRRRSVRLHLNGERKSSSTTSTTSESVASVWDDGEPSEPPLPLSVALHDRMAQAESMHDRVDFADFVDLAESPRLPHLHNGQQQWRRVERSATFSLLRRDDEVLALARLDATVEEVASILSATTDQAHSAAMNGLYGDAFIAGSVAYVQRAQDYAYQHLSVKTCNFVRPDMMSKNEQWCFSERMRRKADGESFTLVQGSLSESQAQSLPARQALKDETKRVAQLHGVTAAYLVERLEGSHGLRVVFHAICTPGYDEQEAQHAVIVPRSAVRARILRFARGISHLSQLVHRRRFGAQVMAEHSAFQVNNTRCTCCTRRLTMFMNLLPRTRCYLCGYHVCVVCSTSERMETHNGRLASIAICTRCRSTVKACNYEHMLTVSRGPVRILPDSPRLLPSSPSGSSVKSTTSSSSQMLAELLGGIVEDDTTSGRRHAAFKVLEQLLTADQADNQAQADINAGLLSATTKAKAVEASTRALAVDKYPADPALCQVASAAARPYPMLPALVDLKSDATEPAEPIQCPIPDNEDVRLAAIDHYKLHDLANIPELNVICTLAAAEMNCPHSVATLVERTVVTLLATNSPENWDVGSGNPREQTFCQHFVMEDKPLLVTHAEADMRFYHIAPVVLRSLRFYAGFPISVTVPKRGANVPEKVIVGALCCLDAKPHEMTRSQYWRLMKLAEAAAEILERRANECLENSEKYPKKGPTTESTTSGAAVAC